MPPSTTATLLISLEHVMHETRNMLDALDIATAAMLPDRREIKRRVLEIEAGACELIEWLGAARLEDQSN